METGQLTPEQIVATYRADTQKLLAYLPYLREMSGKIAAQLYEQDGIAQHSLKFPVYDSNLLRFVKEAEQSVYMNRNYRYIYSRYRIKDTFDELAVIEKCTIQQMDVIGGILSGYIMGGRTKAVLWTEGLRNGVYMAALNKADELIRLWETGKEQ